MSLPLSSSSTPCCECERKVKTWNCVQCNNDAFCDDCWVKQRPHRPGAVGIDGRPHEKVDPEVVDRLTRIFGNNRSPEEQEALHVSDINTTWFGVTRGPNHGQPMLYYSRRMQDIMTESQTGRHTERFPHLVSFVGQTGAGKSTIVKMLIDREQARTQTRPHGADSFPTPVTGLVNDLIPTTGDVHLYSDPATYLELRPTLYADCEGMSGGEKLPMGAACKEKLEAAKANSRITKSKLRKPLEWANGAKAQSREYSVKRLYPRILYTFSDVIVFVLREARVFQTEVLQKLIEWAYSSIDKSINQPSLPHIVIVLNATENAIDDEQWDLKVATAKLLDDYRDSVHQVQKLQNIVASLKTIGKNITSTKELLEYYYSSITVVRIPTKGRYMQIDEQIGKLHQVIQQKCTLSFAHKKSVRMLLNSERLLQYVNSAYDHFSRRLDEPFDFVKEALRHNPMPQDFRGHILNLMRTMYHEPENVKQNKRAKELLWLLSRPIASWVMLAVAREGFQGTYRTLLWNTFLHPIKEAFDEFCDQWLRCGFEFNGNICCNVKSSHKKGHQASTGKIFAKGVYLPEFNPETFFDDWMKEIGKHLDTLNNRLNEKAVDGPESDQVSRLHRQDIPSFFPKLGGAAKFISHATCFCCVRKIPEHVLPCGHVLCKPCIQSFGVSVGGGVYELTCCPLHPTQTRWRHNPARVKFKPHGAGVRVLCLDGGGIRGIIELAILRAIEKKLGGFVPVQNFFDLIVGTSTGGIIALGLGVKKWPVTYCMNQFKALCFEAFTPRPLKRLALVSHKSYYKTKPLEGALETAFDSDTLLFGGTAHAERSNIKVAVTSTSAAEHRPVILTNYNTAGPERDNLSYQFVRSPDPTTEIKVWEAARATAAAPLYFKPFVKAETGITYTDGGIHHNCPAWIAHHERRVLWEDMKNQEPDIFLSIGTGLSHTVDSPNKIRKGESIHQKRTATGLTYMFRMAYNIIDNQLNCENTWRDYLAKTSPSTEAGRRHMRINVELKGQRPNLDQIDEVQALESQALYSASQNPDIHELAHRLVASSFYFEKQEEFPHEPGKYSCQGTITCKFEKGSRSLKGLGKILTNCLKGEFGPFFLLQENYDTPEEVQHEIAIPPAVLAKMCSHGVFDLQVPLHISSQHQSSSTRLSLCLQELSYQIHDSTAYASRYLAISGFPRALFASTFLHKPLPPLPPKLETAPHVAGGIKAKSTTHLPAVPERPATQPRASTSSSGSSDKDKEHSPTASRSKLPDLLRVGSLQGLRGRMGLGKGSGDAGSGTPSPSPSPLGEVVGGVTVEAPTHMGIGVEYPQQRQRQQQKRRSLDSDGGWYQYHDVRMSAVEVGARGDEGVVVEDVPVAAGGVVVRERAKVGRGGRIGVEVKEIGVGVDDFDDDEDGFEDYGVDVAQSV